MNTFGVTYREYRIDEPRIDDDIAATGSVADYVRFLNTAPIVLILRDQDGLDDPGTFGGSNVFRYVIVPGGQQLSTGSRFPQDLERPSTTLRMVPHL
jgi:hypothetical protein